MDSKIFLNQENCVFLSLTSIVLRMDYLIDQDNIDARHVCGMGIPMH